MDKVPQIPVGFLFTVSYLVLNITSFTCKKSAKTAYGEGKFPFQPVSLEAMSRCFSHMSQTFCHLEGTCQHSSLGNSQSLNLNKSLP